MSWGRIKLGGWLNRETAPWLFEAVRLTCKECGETAEEVHVLARSQTCYPCEHTRGYDVQEAPGSWGSMRDLLREVD